VSVRWLALLLVLALLPTAELVEQGAHVVEHVVRGEAADHDAHHDARDNDQGAHDDGDGHGDSHDEHACTGLVHVCGGGHGAGLTATRHVPALAGGVVVAFAELAPPHDLRDLAALPPPHRPPIAPTT
jgi:hypothetical protein